MLLRSIRMCEKVVGGVMLSGTSPSTIMFQGGWVNLNCLCLSSEGGLLQTHVSIK